MADILITGISGYIGRALAELLLSRGHSVAGLVRPGRTPRLAHGIQLIEGDALDQDDVRVAGAGCDVLVHLVGTRHPAPWKQQEFESIDAGSLEATAAAAKALGNPHVVYVSVAHPAPTMRGYIAVRMWCEAELARLRIRRTIIRPWYVLGRGHRWPSILKPFYALAERLPSTRDVALRLGLVTHQEMIGSLAWAVEHPPDDVRILEVPDIRTLGRTLNPAAEAEAAGRRFVRPA